MRPACAGACRPSDLAPAAIQRGRPRVASGPGRAWARQGKSAGRSAPAGPSALRSARATPAPACSAKPFSALRRGPCAWRSSLRGRNLPGHIPSAAAAPTHARAPTSGALSRIMAAGLFAPFSARAAMALAQPVASPRLAQAPAASGSREALFSCYLFCFGSVVFCIIAGLRGLSFKAGVKQLNRRPKWLAR